MDQYATKFMMQFGVSEAEATALLREPDEIDIEELCSAGTRPVTHQVLVHQILRERYHNGEEQRGPMSMSTERQRWNGERIQQIIFRVDASNSQQDIEKKTKEALVEGNIRLTPTRFLAYLNDAMNLEKENLAFPYLTMNSTVWASLMTFEVIADTMVSDDFIYGGITNELTPLIVGHILIQAPIQFPRVKVLEWMATPLGLLIATNVFEIQQLDKQLGRDFEPTPEVKRLIAENIERAKEFRDSRSSKSK